MEWTLGRVGATGSVQQVGDGEIAYTADDEVIPLSIPDLSPGSYRLTVDWDDDSDDATDQELFLVEDAPVTRVTLTKQGPEGSGGKPTQTGADSG